MSRSHRRRRILPNGRNAGSPERFMALPHRIINSEAYRSLDCVARALLVELSARENGKNNGSLWLSSKDATDLLGLSDERAVLRAFDDLQERGLIALTKDAHFAVKAGETSRARCWRLTWIWWEKSGPSNDWQGYIAPPHTKARKRGDRGLRALARYRKGMAAGKIPVVDFTALPPVTLETAVKPAVESPAGFAGYDAKPPFSVTVNSTLHTAATIPCTGWALAPGKLLPVDYYPLGWMAA